MDALRWPEAAGVGRFFLFARGFCGGLAGEAEAFHEVNGPEDAVARDADERLGNEALVGLQDSGNAIAEAGDAEAFFRAHGIGEDVTVIGGESGCEEMAQVFPAVAVVLFAAFHVAIFEVVSDDFFDFGGAQVGLVGVEELLCLSFFERFGGDVARFGAAMQRQVHGEGVFGGSEVDDADVGILLHDGDGVAEVLRGALADPVVLNHEDVFAGAVA